MPAKTIKLDGGRIVTLKSIRLANGHLLVPVRSPEDRRQAIWQEVAPGDPLFKRWSSVAVDEPDPREAA